MAYTEDETARMLLAALVEPNHSMTGQLVRLIGVAETVTLIRTPDAPLPPQVDPLDGLRWRESAATRYRPGLAAEVQQRTAGHDLRLLTPGNPGWPVALADLGDRAPVALWVRGNPELLTASLTSRVTITGARAATKYGEETTQMLASELAAEPRIIVSGGAYGIDAAAHRAALATRRASTVAVLSSGVDRAYPRAHEDLFGQITDDGGLLVSEAAPETAPTRWRFMARARLLAALGGATIIPEAGWNSMALLVAARATDLGRPVGAIPGPITSASSAGCHRLLREDMAEIVTSRGDVTDMLEPRPFRLGPAYEMAARRAAIGASPSATRPAL